MPWAFVLTYQTPGSIFFMPSIGTPFAAEAEKPARPLELCKAAGHPSASVGAGAMSPSWLYHQAGDTCRFSSHPQIVGLQGNLIFLKKGDFWSRNGEVKLEKTVLEVTRLIKDPHF